MARAVGEDEADETGRSLRYSFRHLASSFRSATSDAVSFKEKDDDQVELQWAAIERLPTFERLRTSLFDHKLLNDGKEDQGRRKMEMIDVTKLGALERRVFIEKLITKIEEDNLQLLKKLKERMDRVGLKLPTIEVRYENLCVEAECEVVHGKPLPTLWNTIKSIFSVSLCKSQATKIKILKDVSGIIKPSRMTLLLGPPGCGKTTLLQALAGKLSPSLKVTGETYYNGYKFTEFVPQKTSAYISQYDLHISEMTVRETLDFSARCQGIGSRADILKEVSKREKLHGIIPEPDIDTYMKILGLDICADTIVGDAMNRGISGGEKKRLTTGEMIIGPTKVLFMDEISTGLDSSTTFQIVTCLQQLTHITGATILISLLQPAPETFDLFDDIILMAEGKTVYHGPRIYVQEFFEHCGFSCPPRKGVADFLQEVLSEKDQAQYWYHKDRPHSYVSIDMFNAAFKEFHAGQKLNEELCTAFNKSESHKNALSLSIYSLGKLELLKACTAREWLLMKRNSFVYVFKSAQLVLIALITMTVFIRSRMKIDEVHASYFMGSLFYALIRLVCNGIAELPLSGSRLPIFYKQRDFYFYPAWAYSIPSTILKIPLSLLDAVLWTCLTYYVIGYSPEPGRFFRQLLLLFLVHQVSTSLFRFIASVIRNQSVAADFGQFTILVLFLFGGFLIPGPSLPDWIKWGFWISPITYAEIGVSVNEFLAPRWQQVSPSNVTLGHQILRKRGLDYSDYFYWISVGALIGFWMIFNVGFTFALSYFKRAFRPGILTALMGASGAGKTTLMDVLSGRKTGGHIDGEIKIGGYPKIQETYARISAYCEQTDIHSPQITIEESVKYSAWLRLPEQVDKHKRLEFVAEVLQMIELDEIKDALVGIPGVSGISPEQRKRLTIAVELVSNPSIIFMDEPTSGLDARAAAIVMRVVKNIVNTNRTIVCTIHQPSIDIFESFDELILMKRGGQMIYSGELGQHSSRLIEYFEGIPGVPRIKENHNPATWMLDVTSPSAEAQLGVDFAHLYKESHLYRRNEELVKELSLPVEGSEELHFATRFPQNGWQQFKACLWKQHLSYWRSPGYNLSRLILLTASSLLYGGLLRRKGRKMDDEQDFFSIIGSLFGIVIIIGISNCASVLPIITTQRTIVYRERFAGMYSSWAYSIAQVIVELPYVFLEAALFSTITYPLVNFYGSVYKVFWYFYAMFCTLLYYKYFGMMLVSLTPTHQMAAICASFSYPLMGLFCGYLIPGPKLPKWWGWCYWISPMSWSLKGFLTPQYGDIKQEMIAFGERKSVSAFLESHYGYKHPDLPIIAIVLIAYPIFFAFIFAYCIAKLNFQRR
ncbi:PREDICTED: pleiotropic drug resistance protein 3 isoform X4 [Theobroma cacao]|uniref:Pleiotropic drug resistance protein 3 isoform X4 n=1 Tax=Theobroma cacao TaxID=3641 RepID=A0AB32WDC5_THECC|nr:PREDICTED: pleiotropic drug resistance protein 3 isoform X4 [Theobroma cacao]